MFFFRELPSRTGKTNNRMNRTLYVNADDFVNESQRLMRRLTNKKSDAETVRTVVRVYSVTEDDEERLECEYSFQHADTREELQKKISRLESENASLKAKLKANK